MRTIIIDEAVLQDLLSKANGEPINIPVAVDWPELQLPNDARCANAIALAQNEPIPHADPSVFIFRINPTPGPSNAKPLRSRRPPTSPSKDPS